MSALTLRSGYDAPDTDRDPDTERDPDSRFATTVRKATTGMNPAYLAAGAAAVGLGAWWFFFRTPSVKDGYESAAKVDKDTHLQVFDRDVAKAVWGRLTGYLGRPSGGGLYELAMVGTVTPSMTTVQPQAEIVKTVGAGAGLALVDIGLGLGSPSPAHLRIVGSVEEAKSYASAGGMYAVLAGSQADLAELIGVVPGPKPGPGPVPTPKPGPVPPVPTPADLPPNPLTDPDGYNRWALAHGYPPYTPPGGKTPIPAPAPGTDWTKVIPGLLGGGGGGGTKPPVVPTDLPPDPITDPDGFRRWLEAHGGGGGGGAKPPPVVAPPSPGKPIASGSTMIGPYKTAVVQKAISRWFKSGASTPMLPASTNGKLRAGPWIPYPVGAYVPNDEDGKFGSRTHLMLQAFGRGAITDDTVLAGSILTMYPASGAPAGTPPSGGGGSALGLPPGVNIFDPSTYPPGFDPKNPETWPTGGESGDDSSLYDTHGGGI